MKIHVFLIGAVGGGLVAYALAQYNFANEQTLPQNTSTYLIGAAGAGLLLYFAHHHYKDLTLPKI